MPSCKVLFVLTKYFRLTNYMWMFSEGFYLHKLIASAFAEQKSLLVFYLIGWGKPLEDPLDSIRSVVILIPSSSGSFCLYFHHF
jgi:hypothetical protein